MIYSRCYVAFIMAEFRQKVNCSYCGNVNTVSVITKQTKNSRSVKVTKCTECKRHNGVKEVLCRNDT